MDGMQIALPILGIVAAAAVTFYAVSFNEIREVSKQHQSTMCSSTNLIQLYISKILKFHSQFLAQKSFSDFEESENENGGYRPSSSSRERRARRQASKNSKR